MLVFEKVEMRPLFTIPFSCVRAKENINDQDELSGIRDKTQRNSNESNESKHHPYKLLVIKGPGAKDVPFQRCMQTHALAPLIEVCILSD